MRDPRFTPEAGDRIRVRAHLVARVLSVSDLSVHYTIEQTQHANAVLVTRAAWLAMTRDGEVLPFDAVEVVR